MLSRPHLHTSILTFGHGRYAWAAAIVVTVASTAYLLDHPVGPPNGGTILGYTLGTIGLLLIAWLAWFGIRKRQYRGTRVTLEEWLSAHVYLGLALIVVATLHTGFRFHWNVHTVAFVFMVIVIASGITGLWAYLSQPRLMSDNRAGQLLPELAKQLAELDLEARKAAALFDPPESDIIEGVRHATGPPARRIGVGEILFGQRREELLPDTTERVVSRLKERMLGDKPLSAGQVVPLVQLLTRRAALFNQCRRDYRYRVLLTFWRAIHLPVTFALLVALVTHVFVVLYYR
jgi:hypothetical protein